MPSSGNPNKNNYFSTQCAFLFQHADGQKIIDCDKLQHTPEKEDTSVTETSEERETVLEKSKKIVKPQVTIDSAIDTSEKSGKSQQEIDPVEELSRSATRTMIREPEIDQNRTPQHHPDRLEERDRDSHVTKFIHFLLASLVRKMCQKNTLSLRYLQLLNVL